MNKEERISKAKKFLGELLDESLEWSCTDTQHDLRDEFIEILGIENVPSWIVQPQED